MVGGLFNMSNDVHRFGSCPSFSIIFIQNSRYTLGYVFGDLLHKDLEEFVSDWNSHPIRKNRAVTTPHGCPIDIYDMPELYGKSYEAFMLHW